MPAGCPGDGDPGQQGAADVTEAIAWAACHLAESLGAAAILTPTQTGATAREVASFRPSALIVAAAADAIVRRQLALVWGVIPVAVEMAPDTDSTLHAAIRAGEATGPDPPGRSGGADLRRPAERAGLHQPHRGPAGMMRAGVAAAEGNTD